MLSPAQTAEMSAVFEGYVSHLGTSLLYVALNSVLLMAGIWLYSITIAKGHSLVGKLFVDKTGAEPNAAVGIALGGYIIAVAFVSTRAASSSGPLVPSIVNTLLWAGTANIVLLLLRWIGDVVTPGSWTDEVFEKKNVAVAWVEFALFVGFGLIIGRYVE